MPPPFFGIYIRTILFAMAGFIPIRKRRNGQSADWQSQTGLQLPPMQNRQKFQIGLADGLASPVRYEWNRNESSYS